MSTLDPFENSAKAPVRPNYAQVWRVPQELANQRAGVRLLDLRVRFERAIDQEQVPEEKVGSCYEHL